MSSQRRSRPHSRLQVAVCRRIRLHAMKPSSKCEQLDSCQRAADHATDASCPRPVLNLQTAPVKLELCGFFSKASRTRGLWYSCRTKSRTHKARLRCACCSRSTHARDTACPKLGRMHASNSPSTTFNASAHMAKAPVCATLAYALHPRVRRQQHALRCALHLLPPQALRPWGQKRSWYGDASLQAPRPSTVPKALCPRTSINLVRLATNMRRWCAQGCNCMLLCFVMLLQCCASKRCCGGDNVQHVYNVVDVNATTCPADPNPVPTGVQHSKMGTSACGKIHHQSGQLDQLPSAVGNWNTHRHLRRQLPCPSAIHCTHNKLATSQIRRWGCSA